MKHLPMIGASVFAALFTVAGSAGAQTPSAGPPPPPPAALPAPKPAAAPAPAPVAKPAAAPAAAAKPAAAPAAAGKPAAPAAPVAAAPPPPPTPKPASELDQLKMFEGTWRCDGKQPAGPMGPEQVYKSSFKGKRDVENFWLAFEYSQKKSKLHTLPIKAKGFLGY